MWNANIDINCGTGFDRNDRITKLRLDGGEKEGSFEKGLLLMLKRIGSIIIF